MNITFPRWAYAKYGPKTFGLGESGDGAFFKITCVYGTADDEDAREAMDFIREARLVSHQTGKSPTRLAAELAASQEEVARLRGALGELSNQPFALYDGEKWYADEEAAICSCANMQNLQKVFLESQLDRLNK